MAGNSIYQRDDKQERQRKPEEMEKGDAGSNICEANAGREGETFFGFCEKIKKVYLYKKRNNYIILLNNRMPEEHMSNYSFFTNPVVILVIGSIFTTIVAVVIFKLSNQNKFPLFVYSTHKLISNYVSSCKGLTIKLKEKDIESLYVTKLAVWNKGKASICNYDIAEKDPLKFFIGKNTSILDYGIVGENDDSISPKLRLTEDMKYIVIDFDHLNYNNGFVIQLFHTKNENDFDVSGTLKCYKGKICKSKNLLDLNAYITDPLISTLRKKNNTTDKSEENKIRRLFQKVFSILYFIFINVFLVISSIEVVFDVKIISENTTVETTIFAKIVVLTFTVVVLVTTIIYTKFLNKRRIPKTLQKYL